MDVTTALVGFIFVCIIFPHIIKDKNQFYIAFGMVVVTILLHSLALMFNAPGFNRFIMVVIGLLHAAALVLLVLAAGGLRAQELMGEMGRAIEVMRRGETEKEVIIPLTGQQPKPRNREEPARRYEINDPPPPPPAGAGSGPAPAPPNRPKDDGSLPLE